MKVIIATFGTRGDVQPFVGLSVALKAAGHHPIIATSPTFKTWIESYGIEFADIHGPDPKTAFAVCVSKGFFTLQFLRKVRELFSPMIRDVGLTMVKLAQQQQPDLVCCTFSTIYAGIHIKEKFGIPCAIMSYIPWGPTKYYFSSYAHKLFQASAVKPHKRNLYSHQIIDYMYGKLTQPMMGQFRAEVGLPNITSFFDWQAKNEAPVLTCYSPAVVPPPPDWPATHRQVGYWWLPPTDLTTLDTRTKDTMSAVSQFISAGDKPIYIGFGSVPLSEADQVERITKLVLKAVKLSGQRAIIATGWGAIELPSTVDTPLGKKLIAKWNKQTVPDDAASQSEAVTDDDSDSSSSDEIPENNIRQKSPEHNISIKSPITVPDNCFVLDAIPHDWMFTADKLKVIVHHGGAGTTGAALKAGVPSVICPFFGDHYLWSQRLYEVGAGPKPLPHDKLDAHKLAQRIKECVNDKVMREKTQVIAGKINGEDGLKDGVKALEELVANKGKWAANGITKPGVTAAGTAAQFESFAGASR